MNQDQNQNNRYVRKAMSMIDHINLDKREQDECTDFEIFQNHKDGVLSNKFVIRYNERNYYCSIRSDGQIDIEPALFRLIVPVESVNWDDYQYILADTIPKPKK